jgi:HYR domain/GEVED domain/Domain of unknown function DUF11
MTVQSRFQISVIILCAFFFFSAQTRVSAQCDLVSPDAPHNGIDSDCDGLDALYLQMPPYVYTTEGQVFDLYFRNIFLSKHPQHYSYAVVTPLTGGSANAERWTITPSIGQAGEYPITIHIKNSSGQVMASVSSVMRVAAAQSPAGVSAKRFIMLGHSLVDQGVTPYYLRQLTSAAGNPTVTYHGTRLSYTDQTTNHEGKGGASWRYFAQDAASPLRSFGQLNLRNYFNQVMCQGCTPDYFVIQLDGNDFCFNGQVNGGTMQEIDDFIDGIYQADILPLINAIRTTSPNTKIGICLTVPANGQPNIFPNFFGPTSILGDHFRWKKIVSRIQTKYTTYFGGREDENLFLIPIHLGVDDVAHFDSYDPVHPYASNAANGYAPTSRAIYGWMKHLMAASVANCSINAQVTQVNCNANNSFSNLSDDTYTYTLDVNGINAGTNWTAFAQGQSISGTLGTSKTFGPFAANAIPQSFEISAQSNSSCKTQVAVSSAPCSNGTPVKSDLQLNIVTPNTQPGIFTPFKVTYSVYNNSGNVAEGVWVKVPKPTQVQILSANPIVASQGNFDWSYTNLWTVGTIPPFGTATLSFDYYNVAGGTFHVYAQVYAQVQPDTDSAPNNGNGTSALEDDEFALIIGQTANPCANDIIPPNIQNCPASQTLTTTTGSTIATWAAPTATDNCPGAIALNASQLSGVTFAVGVTTVTYTARDAANNTKTCTFIIQVSQPQASTCTGNLLQNAGFESSLVNWFGTGGQISTDASSGTKSLQMCTQGTNILQTVVADAGKTYTLNWKGKTAGAGQNIAVALKFMSPTFITLSSDFYTFNSVGVFGSDTRQLTAPTGTAYVEVSFYKSNSGCVLLDDICLTVNGLSLCSPDIVPPVLSNCPSTQTVTTSTSQAVATWTAPTATDVCSTNVTLSASHNPGANFALGSTTVTYTARDAANNTSTCSFTVQVNATGQPYCTSVSAFPWENWIAQVQVGTVQNASGKSPYSAFSTPQFTVSKSAATAIILTAGYSYFTSDAYWRIWIDLNQDQVFQVSEKVFEGRATSLLNSAITIPPNTLSGTTKMRVSMTKNAFADPCGNIASGEVEDYNIQIANTLGSSDVRQNHLPVSFDEVTLFPNPALDYVQVVTPDWAGAAVQWKLYNQLGIEITRGEIPGGLDAQINLTTVPEGNYFLHLEIEGKRAIMKQLCVHGR